MTGRFAMALLLTLATPAFSQDDTKTMTSFADLRAEVLDAIGGATRRVWLVSDYLTDGEIVSALYLAQYRKLDVQVLLGRSKANFYMSRLNYLKNQNIPVFLKPDTFKPGQPTALLADDRLLLIDGDLDFLAKVRQYHLQIASTERRDVFQAGFSSAANLRVPAVPHQIPLVGKATGRGRVYSPGLSTSSGASAPIPAGVVRSSNGSPRIDESGAYVYDRASQPRPSDVPAKLPKAVKWGQQPARPKPKSEVFRNPEPAPAAAPASDSEPPALPQDGG